MNTHDPSILAHHSMWHIRPNYNEWLSRVAHALGEQIRHAPDLTHLLSWGFDTNPSNDHERRQQLFIYLSIAAGSMISGRAEYPEGPYWYGRKMVEAEARRVLEKNFYGYPAEISRRSRGDISDVGKALYRISLRQFIELLSDRDTLRLIFRIFDPKDSVYPEWWWKQGGVSEEHRSASVFMDWLLRVIWSRRGLPRKPELTTWARRQTMSWIFRTRRPARYLDKLVHPEPWMFPHARKYLAEQRVRRKSSTIRVSRTALRDARGMRIREAFLKKAVRSLVSKPVSVKREKRRR